MKWSDTATKKIDELSKSILLKKIMLGFVINSYATHDKLFRYIHFLLALLTPLLAILNDYAGSSNIFTIIFSVIVAGMIKIKEYITYDKVRDSAKSQMIKYTQLLTTIENESGKSDTQIQAEADFLYLIRREYTMIEVDDPELTLSEQIKFHQYCKDKNIPFEEDIDKIKKIINITVKSSNEITNDVSNNVTNNDTNNLNNLHTHNNSLKTTYDNSLKTTYDNSLKTNHNSLKTIHEQTTDTIDDEKQNEPIPTTHKVLSLYQYDKKTYKNSLKKINVNEEMNTTIERLRNL